MNIAFVTVQAQEKGFTGNEPLALCGVMLAEFTTGLDDQPLLHSGGPKFFGYRDTEQLLITLNMVDIVVGHNIIDYGYMILQKYYPDTVLHTDLATFDLLTAIEDELGIRVKLSSLAESIGKNRLGTGLTSVNLWQNNQFDKVRRFMIRDLHILFDVFYAVMTNDEFEILHPNGHDSATLDTTGWHRMIPAMTRSERGY